MQSSRTNASLQIFNCLMGFPIPVFVSVIPILSSDREKQYAVLSIRLLRSVSLQLQLQLQENYISKKVSKALRMVDILVCHSVSFRLL